MSVSNVIRAIKMFYNFFGYASALFIFLINIVWLCCSFAFAVVPWLCICIAIIFIGSKFVKLKVTYNNKSMIHLLGAGGGSNTTPPHLYWPVANRGAAFDAPENSAAALKRVSKIIRIQIFVFIYSLVFFFIVVVDRKVCVKELQIGAV